MEKLVFNDPHEMYDVVVHGVDIYNIETGDYVYVQNDKNDFYIDHLNADEADYVAKECEHYWGEELYKGSITDGDVETLSLCRDLYKEGTWVLANKTFLDKSNETHLEEKVIVCSTPKGYIKSFQEKFTPFESLPGTWLRSVDVQYTPDKKKACKYRMTEYCKTFDWRDKEKYHITPEVCEVVNAKACYACMMLDRNRSESRS